MYASLGRHLPAGLGVFVLWGAQDDVCRRLVSRRDGTLGSISSVSPPRPAGDGMQSATSGWMAMCTRGPSVSGDKRRQGSGAYPPLERRACWMPYGVPSCCAQQSGWCPHKNKPSDTAHHQAPAHGRCVGSVPTLARWRQPSHWRWLARVGHPVSSRIWPWKAYHNTQNQHWVSPEPRDQPQYLLPNPAVPQYLQTAFPVHRIIYFPQVDENPAQRVLLNESKLVVKFCLHDSRPTTVPSPKAMQIVMELDQRQPLIQNLLGNLPQYLQKTNPSKFARVSLWDQNSNRPQHLPWDLAQLSNVQNQPDHKSPSVPGPFKTLIFILGFYPL